MLPRLLLRRGFASSGTRRLLLQGKAVGTSGGGEPVQTSNYEKFERLISDSDQRQEAQAAAAQPPGQRLHSFDVFSEKTHSEQTAVDAYVPDGFTINNVRLKGPVLLLPNMSLLLDVASVGELGAAALKVLAVLKPRPELLIVGTGKTMQLLPQETRAYLKDLRISADTMDTPHACSTFNILVQEGRNVAAVLLPIVPTSAVTGKPL